MTSSDLSGDLPEELPLMQYQNALRDYWRIAALEGEKNQDLFIPDQ